ncbi:hypothetical protein LRHMDP2_118 [Lacticaseibacillus rhamnosus LRHMDP2]|nr:hypothetical protein LRHMDP2_118 [Lacticaseibacillus rhamnosus LRHMDP2]
MTLSMSRTFKVAAKNGSIFWALRKRYRKIKPGGIQNE